MLIYVLRHGIAEEAAPGSSDEARALVPEGSRKLRSVLRVAKAAGVSPSIILTSPYKRAVQTAQLAAETLSFEGELIQTKALAPESSPEQVWGEVRLHKHASEVLLSGHEPLLSQTIAFLLAAPSLQVDLKKGALACVQIDRFGAQPFVRHWNGKHGHLACVQIDRFGAQPRGVLLWLITPKLSKAE